LVGRIAALSGAVGLIEALQSAGIGYDSSPAFGPMLGKGDQGGSDRLATADQDGLRKGA